MYDKIIFDRYYCINFAKIKIIMAYYILYSLLMFSLFYAFKSFIFMLVPGEVWILIISTCFVWHPVKSVNKNRVLTARTHSNRLINTCISSSLIYAC